MTNTPISQELKTRTEEFLLENLNSDQWTVDSGTNGQYELNSHLGLNALPSLKNEDHFQESFVLKNNSVPELHIKYGFIGGAAPVVIEVGYMAFRWIIKNPQVVKFVVDMVKDYVTSGRDKLKLKKHTEISYADQVSRLT